MCAKPLLTIAIPTFNRAAYLGELLDSLWPQLKTESRVELLISDNASSDETEATVQEFVARGLQVRYLRNSTNLGSDRNFLQCFEQASGDYVWLFGDDDRMPQGSVGLVLDLLEKTEPDLVYVTPMEFRDTPLDAYRRDRFKRPPEEVSSARHFAWMVGNMFTLITCNIVNRRRARSIIQIPLERLIGTGLVHLGWVLALLREFRKGIYVYDVLVSVRGGNRSGYSISQIFGRNYKQLTEEILGAQSSLTKTLQSDVVRYCLPFLVLEIRKQNFGVFLHEDFDAALRPLFGREAEYWLFLFPIISAPVPVAEVWFKGIKVFRKGTQLANMMRSPGRLLQLCRA